MSTPEIAVGWKGLQTWTLAEAGVTREAGRVRVPTRDGCGRELYAKLFDGRTGRSWYEQQGIRLRPFGLETLSDDADKPSSGLVIAEGESDALALRQFVPSLGTDDVPVFDVVGVPGARAWKPAWVSAYGLDKYAVAYVIGDGDESGRQFNWDVRLSLSGARIVGLPDGEDARHFVQTQGADALLALFDAADDRAAVEALFPARAEVLCVAA
jgi:hypothetical protein